MKIRSRKNRAGKVIRYPVGNDSVLAREVERTCEPAVEVGTPIILNIGSSGVQPVQPEPAPVSESSVAPIAPKEVGEELPPTHLVGNVDEVESGLRDYLGVAKVKVKGIRKKRIDVETNEGTKLRYGKTVDRKGRIHWNRVTTKPSEEDVSDEDEDDSSDSSEGNFWD